MATGPTWTPSRFNIVTRSDDGLLLLYNTFSGAFFAFRAHEADAVASILAGPPLEDPSGVASLLAVQGFLVLSSHDELASAKCLHDRMAHKDHLHIILMVTERCNFRCLYCYEDSKQRTMPRKVADSIVYFLRRESAELRSLSLGWFGGEPLAAITMIEDLSRPIVNICEKRGIKYSADITTNGYLLTADRLKRCFAAQILRFQITLDGPAETHNRLRPLAGGGSTFSSIFRNLCVLRDQPNDFHARIRVNFSPDNVDHIPRLLCSLGREFRGDHRFSIHFHAIGHWGGPHDDQVKTCDKNTATGYEIAFMSMASEHGLGLNAWEDSLKPYGSVCYAAKPRSLVIGCDGTIYKCSVAFRDSTNQIGKLSPDGVLHIDEGLHRLWTSTGEETDTECQLCALRPACQGNFCPLGTMQRDRKMCPAFKTHSNDMLSVLAHARQRSF